MTAARDIWQRIETIHAVTYFADESIAAAKDAGLRGFWMGYFGFRAAPLGAVQPGAVEAAFANFAASMVRRSLPDAWRFAAPTDLVAVRASAAAGALRRVGSDVADMAAEVNPSLACVVERCASIGRPMFAANRDVVGFDDPAAQLWQHCTTLREHRGDGHVMALAAAGVDGCEAHRLVAADQGHPDAVFRDNRGWSESDWEQAGDRLGDRGLATMTDGRCELTDQGRRLRAEIEHLTDVLAMAPYEEGLGRSGLDALIAEVTPVAVQVARSGVIPYPNPMALPPLVN